MSEEQQSGPAPAAESALAASPLPPDPGSAPLPGRRTSRRQVLLALLAVSLYFAWRSIGPRNFVPGRDGVSFLVAKPAPPFSLAARDGRTLSLPDFAGKKVVLSFWASWCGPCQVELPQLADFYRRHHQAHPEFEILAISIDENPGEALRYASQEQLPFPVLLDPQSNAARDYSVAGIPALFVIGEDGKVKYARTGLADGIEPLLLGQLGIAIP